MAKMKIDVSYSVDGWMHHELWHMEPERAKAKARDMIQSDAVEMVTLMKHGYIMTLMYIKKSHERRQPDSRCNPEICNQGDCDPAGDVLQMGRGPEGQGCQMGQSPEDTLDKPGWQGAVPGKGAEANLPGDTA